MATLSDLARRELEILHLVIEGKTKNGKKRCRNPKLVKVNR